MKFNCLFFLCLLLIAGVTVSAQSKKRKPNIVLIMADDMGFSDIGCYGGEIPTPNLDALALNGLPFTQFYNTARCSPSRASLLTGLHPHMAGMGRLADETIGDTLIGPEGYLRHLNDKCVTIAEVLKLTGYSTYMAGKWHLGMRAEANWPLQRGFDKFYGVLGGSTSYFKPQGRSTLTLGNKTLNPPTDKAYYTTDVFTDFAISKVKEHHSANPFFLFLAFNAPHWPLHARSADIDKFIGKYRLGWDSLRVQRLCKLKKLRIIGEDVQLSDRDTEVRAWDTLSEVEKANLDYRMAVYAAQVYRMDYNIGRLITVLKARKMLDNTLIIFLSDNGASAEPYTDKGGLSEDKINDPNVTASVSYGTGWANSSNTPFRKFKSMLYEGGIATPLIIHWPAGLKAQKGSCNTSPGYLLDIMPTIIQISGANYPQKFHGKAINPLTGESLLPIIQGRATSIPQRTMYWEQYGYKAVRQGDFKAVFTAANMYDKTGTSTWELYDVAKDRTELNNIASENPGKLKELIELWEAWANKSHVYPTPAAVAKTKISQD